MLIRMLTIATIWLIFSSSNAGIYMDFIEIQAGELPAVRYMEFLAGKYMGILKPYFQQTSMPCTDFMARWVPAGDFQLA